MNEHINVKFRDVYDCLNDKFTRAELDLALKKSGLLTPLKKVVSLWICSGVIEAIGKTRGLQNQSTSDVFKKVQITAIKTDKIKKTCNRS